jgi:hypothetical protein
MKKTILLVGAGLLANLSIFAQSTPVSQTVQKKSVLLEEFTGIHCGYCPDGHSVANAISDANPGKVVLVNIHAGSFAVPSSGEPDLRTTVGTAIDTWMAPSGYPAGSVQRRAQSGALTTGRGSWTSIANTVVNENSPVNVAMNATLNATTREVTVNVEIFYTSPFTTGTNNYLNVGILQDNFEGPQSNYGNYNPSAILPNGKYLHQHIFRGFINNDGITGDVIDASSSGVITKTFIYTIPATLNSVPLDIANLKFFAFIGKGKNTATTSDVYTAAEVTPTYTNVPAPVATINSITNKIDLGCDSPASIAPIVRVVNGGDVISSLSFSTTVNGGTPSVYDWTGSIPALGTKEITITGIPNFTPGATNNVVVTLTSVNGGTGTVGTTASASKSMTKSASSTGSVYTIEVLTDNYPSETSWELLNSSNTVVASGGPYIGAGGTAAGGADALKTKVHSVTLNASDCYSFKMYDDYGDGLNTGTNPGGGFGFRIKKGSTTLYSKVSKPFECLTPESGTATSDLTEVLKLTYQSEASIEELNNLVNLSVYPNPATDKLNVTFNAQNSDYTITISDVTGRIVSTSKYNNLSGSQDITVELNDIKSGNYIVTVSDSNGTFNKNVFIK